MIAGVVSLILGLTFGQRKEIEWIEGAAIFLAVSIVVLVTAGNDWIKERQFAALFVKDEKFCSVVRQRKLGKIPADQLLVGDVVLLETGDEIPADCLALSCQDLAVDESSLTGESTSITKASITESQEIRATLLSADTAAPPSARNHSFLPSPVLLAGTTVVQGSAYALVIAVGSNSQAGQLFRKLTVDTDPTPLQNKLNALAKDIGNLGFAAACVVLVILIVQFWIFYAVTQDIRETYDSGLIIYAHVEFLVEAITILVVAVPEGLPLAVTVSLAFSVERMLKDQNYVRRLAACETMGGASEICSDKTGTLTTNQMAVQAFWNGSRLVEAGFQPTSLDAVGEHGILRTTPPPTTIAHHPTDQHWFPRLPEEMMSILAEAIAVNSTAFLEDQQTLFSGTSSLDETGVPPTGPRLKHVGSATECALLHLLHDLGIDYNALRQKIGADDKIVYRLPFDSKRKIMTTVVHCPKTPTLYRVIFTGVRGPKFPETVLSFRLEKIHKNRIEKQIIDQMGSKALRTICLAYKDFDPGLEPTWKDQIPSDELDALMQISAAEHLASSLAPPVLEEAARSEATTKQNQRVAYRMEVNLTCLGIAGMRDPIREEVPAAVRRCQDAGIRVRMVTGDNIDTAKQIGLKCNIYRPELGGVAMMGSEFYKAVGGVVCESCRTETCECPTSTQTARQRHASTAGYQQEPGRTGGGGGGGSVGFQVTARRSPKQYLAPTTTTASSHADHTQPFHRQQTPSGHLQHDSTQRHPFDHTRGHFQSLARERDDLIHLDASQTNEGPSTNGDPQDDAVSTVAMDDVLPHVEATSCLREMPVPQSWIRRCYEKLCVCWPGHTVEQQAPLPSQAEETTRLITRKPRRDVVGNPEAFARLARDLEILARSQPQDKYALVLGLKEQGAVVAVTGDGTNDAPALRKADVGFAMGLTGKEVAKQAADIVLLDDNFESIVKAVKWGRNIYDNIRRFLQFQVTVNIVAVITAVIGSTLLRESPLTAVQLLWVNLIMDSFASLALATEPASEDLLNRPPHARNEYLINKLMARNILGQTAYQLCVMMSLIFSGDCWIPEISSEHYARFEGQDGFHQFSQTCGGGRTVTSGRRYRPFSQQEEYRREWTLNVGPSRHYTMVFNVFVWLQIFNMINARKINNELNVWKGALSSPLWMCIMVVIASAQVILVQFGGYALNAHLDGLTWQQWALSLILGAGSLVVGVLLHLLPADKLAFLPQTGRKEEDLLRASRNLALASRGRISTDRISSRLAAGLHNGGSRRLMSPTHDERVRREGFLPAQFVKSAAFGGAELAATRGGQQQHQRELLQQTTSAPQLLSAACPPTVEPSVQ